MPNRLRLTGILTPPADDAFRPGVGYVRFEPADEAAATWAVPGYRPAWPILGVPNAVGGALQEINGGDVFVPGDEPGDAHTGPWMRVSYELQTTAGTWHRGTYLWRAVSTGGGVIDIRTPAPEQEPPIVARPGVPAGALLTTDVGNLVTSKTELDAFRAQTLGRTNPIVNHDATGPNGFEQGSMTTAATTYTDYHSSGTGSDFDVRISVDGGTAQSGQGNMDFAAANLSHQGRMLLSAAIVINSGTAQGIRANGWQTMHGSVVVNLNSNGDGTISFEVPFSQQPIVVASNGDANAVSQATVGIIAAHADTVDIRVRGSNGTPVTGPFRLNYSAMGRA